MRPGEVWALREGDPVRVLTNRWRHGPDGEVSRVVPEGFLIPAGTVMVRFPEVHPANHFPYLPGEVERRLTDQVAA